MTFRLGRSPKQIRLSHVVLDDGSELEAELMVVGVAFCRASSWPNTRASAWSKAASWCARYSRSARLTCSRRWGELGLYVSWRSPKLSAESTKRHSFASVFRRY